MSLVISELTRYTGKSLTGLSRVLIKCPFHADDTPSLAVTLRSLKYPEGSFFCFACGAKSSTHGGWNGLAQKLGLQQTDGSLYLKEWSGDKVETKPYLATQSRTLEDLFEEWDMQNPSTPKKSWRSIEAKTLKLVGAYYGKDGWGAEAIALPLWINGEVVGGIKALYNSASGGRKYFNSKGNWSKEFGLYPLHLKKRWKRVVLVEGPRDALAVIQAGLPALAILGTQSWTSAKRDLLLAMGVERILEALDSDKAGRDSARDIKDSFKGLVNWKRCIMPSGEDPASMGTAFWKSVSKEWR